MSNAATTEHVQEKSETKPVSQAENKVENKVDNATNKTGKTDKTNDLDKTDTTTTSDKKTDKADNDTKSSKEDKDGKSETKDKDASKDEEQDPSKVKVDDTPNSDGFIPGKLISWKICRTKGCARRAARQEPPGYIHQTSRGRGRRKNQRGKEDNHR